MRVWISRVSILLRLVEFAGSVGIIKETGAVSRHTRGPPPSQLLAFL